MGFERIRQSRDDLVLHVEQIGDRLVETLRPEVAAALGVNQLDIDAHALAAALDAALEDIANVELAPDLLQVDGLALVGEGGVAPDDERAADAREVGGQALGHAVNKILLFGVAPHVGERQHEQRKARRAGHRFRGPGSHWRRRACPKRKDPNGSNDIFQRFLAEIDERDLDPPADVLMRRTGDQDAAGFADTLEPRSDIDALAENVLALNQDIAEMDADTVDDAPGFGNDGVAFNHQLLDCDRAFDRVDDGRKLQQQSVAHGLDDAPAPARDDWQRRFTMLPHRPRRPGLVLAHEARIADDVDRHDRGQSAGFGYSNPQERIA